MTSTRQFVLENLLHRNRCTINDLAEAVKINPISVRHHISKLEAEGLVSSEEERHGVGRPRRVYFLTQKGMEQFPSRYLTLSTRMLTELKESLPAGAVKEVFSNMAEKIATDFLTTSNVEDLPIDERVNLAVKLLTDEGFSIGVEEKDGKFLISEISCPYYHVSGEHREICEIDQTMLSTVLGDQVELTQCILDGDPYCTYATPALIEPQEIQTAEV